MNSHDPHHIIAIGASAGGMEEINTFFDHTPLDGVSYIIVQHLSADFKSRMVELLAKHSKLVVKEAENGMKVRSNQVYLIPNDKFMTITDDKLFLTIKEKSRTPNMTIDTLFNSLALNSHTQAIAIILSGLGSDGTKGIQAIKKSGGMVIVRNPETTEFSSMPSHAIATGLVDFVLEPELMPHAIEDYIKYGSVLADNKDDDHTIVAILELIKEKLPLDFSDYKQNTILRRTRRRADYKNFSSLSAYLDYLKVTPEEVQALAQDFLISVTSFFRDKEGYDYLQQTIIPDILVNLSADKEMKIWVAGCATGEEAYSIAILIHEQLNDKYRDVSVKLFATDIDGVALASAGRGVYGPTISKQVSAHRLERYFIKEGENFTVKPEIRRMVIFARHDLVKNPPYCNMHLISCRNVLIYMSSVLQTKIFAMLLFGLKRGSYLFLGLSENPLPIIKNLEVVNKKWKIYKSLETRRVLSFDSFSLPELLDIDRSPILPSPEESIRGSGGMLTEVINAGIINKLGALVICIDSKYHVVKSYGDTTKYLVQKHFNTNLLELLPRTLGVAFSNLIKDTKKSNVESSASKIPLDRDGSLILVSLSVSSLFIRKGEEQTFMVIFTDDTMSFDDPLKIKAVYHEKNYFDQYTLNLEEELKDVKSTLQSTYEQLDASNENMQSFNEELLSANEEMQSTNEEMQSVNEELDTININYQLKNKELLEINDDLNNYFRSNVNGQLFIDSDLLLMKFSPGTVKQINLLESDLGRPLSNISTNIRFETIIQDVKSVLSNGAVVTKEIQTVNGEWYQIMTMPYIHQADNKRNGAIITFNNITELKNTQIELDKKNESLLRINADLDNFVHTASHDLLAPLGNIEVSIDVLNLIKVTDPELNKFLSIINSSVKKFRGLINDIAAIAKLESNMITMETIDLDEILNNIEWSLNNKIVDSKAIINRNLQVKEVVFSKKNLRSILYNIISNSLKFKRAEVPVITISSMREDDNLIISVQDNGIGISKTDKFKIFDMYGRIQTDIEGKGIGLYLAKKMVNAAGGQISVESEIGKGSKFIIYLKMLVEEKQD